MTSNYSVDMLKKAAFVDELNNFLKLLPLDDHTNDLIIKYFEKRIKEIDSAYKK